MRRLNRRDVDSVVATTATQSLRLRTHFQAAIIVQIGWTQVRNSAVILDGNCEGK